MKQKSCKFSSRFKWKNFINDFSLLIQLGQMAQHNNMNTNAQFYGIPFPAIYSAIGVLANALLFSTIQLPINTTAIPIKLCAAH
jgi:hypothetical protein